mgnify:CR=1 FL=1
MSLNTKTKLEIVAATPATVTISLLQQEELQQDPDTGNTPREGPTTSELLRGNFWYFASWNVWMITIILYNSAYELASVD